MSTPLTKSQTGELSLLGSVFLWSFFPIITILSLRSLTALAAAGLSTLVAALFFAMWLTYERQWDQLAVKVAWKYILGTILLNGILFYVLLFIGLTKTTAGNASLIGLMEVFFAMFILHLWQKEYLNKKHVLGAVLMVMGAGLIIFPGSFQLNQGDLLILVATVVPPIGNYFAQCARKLVSSVFLLFVRSFFSGLFLLYLAFVFEGLPTKAVVFDALPFLLINGIFLLGLSKIFWVEAIHRIPITKANALATILPAFTLVFAFFILKEIPTIWQIAGFLPIAAGVLLLTDFGLSPKKTH